MKRQPNRLIRDTARETRYTGLVKNELGMFNKAWYTKSQYKHQVTRPHNSIPVLKKIKKEKEKKGGGGRKVIKKKKKAPSKPLQGSCQNKIIRNKIIIVIII